MSASSVCFICLKAEAPQCRVTRSSKRDNWLECDSCKKWFHAECGGYSVAEYKKFSKGNWLKCIVCCLQHIHILSYPGNTDLSSHVTDAVNKRVTSESYIDKKTLAADLRTTRKSSSAVFEDCNKPTGCNTAVDEVHCFSNSQNINTVSESQAIESENLECKPVPVSEFHSADNILVIDNIRNPAEFSSSKRILHEVNRYCPEVKVDYAYSLAKGGVAIHTVDKSGRDLLLNSLPEDSFGGGYKHLPKNRSCHTVFIKSVCTSISTQDFTKVLHSHCSDSF